MHQRRRGGADPPERTRILQTLNVVFVERPVRKEQRDRHYRPLMRRHDLPSLGGTAAQAYGFTSPSFEEVIVGLSQ